MKTFPTVEDYLEILAGKRDVVTGAVRASSWIGYEFKPIVNLARYDVNFLDSVTDTTLNGNSLTDRQAELSVKLVLKYQRQLSNKNIQVQNVDPPVYRKPLRIVDRTRSISLQDNKICMKFPYDQNMIQLFRDLGKNGQGSIKFDKESKTWQLNLTEYNVNWAYALAQAHEFVIDPEVKTIMDAITACEQTNYAIELQRTDQQYRVTNAASSLVEYINQHLGGFDLQNRNRLVDHAMVLGYTVAADIVQELEQELGGSTQLLMTTRNYEFNNSQDYVKRVIDYTNTVQRWPIFVFNPTPNNSLEEWSQYFSPEEILVVNNRHADAVVIPDNCRVVYTHKPLKNVSRIPVLISHVGMIVGYEKANMVQAAEKIFYTGVKLK